MPTVDVQFRLTRASAPYSFHEDVVVEATMRNRGTTAVDVPYPYASGEVTLRLRLAGGPAREVTTLAPQPGVPAISRTARLEAGKDAAFALALQVWFGEIAPGKHEVQVEVRSPTVSASSPWMAFEVLPLDVGARAIAPSAESEPPWPLLVAWIDRSTQPHRLLRREYLDAERHGSELKATSTSVLAEVLAPPASIAAPSVPRAFPTGREWFAWVEGTEVVCALPRFGARAGAVVRTPIGPDLDLAGNALVYPEPVTEDAPFALLLAARPGRPPSLVGLDFDASGKPVARHSLAPARAPTRIAIAHLSPSRRFVVWSEAADGAREKLRIAPWSRDGGFGATLEIGDIDGRVEALAASASGSRIWVGAVATRAAGPAPGRSAQSEAALHVLKLDAGPGGLRRDPSPRVVPLRVPAPVARADVAAAENGAAWALVEAGPELLLAGTALHAPISVPRVAGAKGERLFLARNRIPFVLSLDPARGFTVAPVPLPPGTAL